MGMIVLAVPMLVITAAVVVMGMRVRVESHAGRLDIVSSPGQGTHIKAALPCKAQTEGEACETEHTTAQG